MEEKEMRELLERLDKSNRQQVKNARLQSVLAILTAVCFLALVFVIVSVVPQFEALFTELDSLLEQAETVMTNLETVTTELTQVDFAGMVNDVDQLVTSSQQGLEETLEKVNSIDFENLNDAIESLAQVIEPLSKFFKVFG